MTHQHLQNAIFDLFVFSLCFALAAPRCCYRRLLSRAQQPEWTEEYVESLFSSIGECYAAAFEWVDLARVCVCVFFFYPPRAPTSPAY